MIEEVPKVSVILPYYNSHATIERAIKSVMIQSVLPLELILINDNSPDWNIIEDKIIGLKCDFLKIIHHSRNLNGSAARNSGINVAVGDYLMFLDSDDYWLTDHIKFNLLEIKNKGLSAPFIVFSSSYVISKSGASRLNQEKVYREISCFSEYLYCDNGSASCITLCISKDVFHSIRFNENLTRFQDVTFLLHSAYLKIPIFQIPISTTVIDWSNNSWYNLTKRKGLNYLFLSNYYNDYRFLFSSQAFDSFIIREYLPFIFYNRSLDLFKLVYNDLRLLKIPLYLYPKLIYYFILGVKDSIIYFFNAKSLFQYS